MPQNAAFDSGELRSLAIGYDRLSSALSPDIRLVDGLNIMATNKGKLNKRPGTVALGGMTAFPNNYYIANMISYETLDSPPNRFVVMSVHTPSAGYDLYYVLLNTIGAKVQMTPIRNNQASTTPHCFAVSRGLCYIRGTSLSSSGETLQTSIFNGTNFNTSWWGLVGPSTPTAVSASAVASTFAFTVNFGWYYVYTWKTITGHESTRSPLQQDQSKPSSSTGPLSSNLCPQVIVQGNADTTQVPSIVIYRSTDGGGNFYKLGEITNTGAGNITFVDRNFTDGTATPSQPYPDSALDTSQISPTLTSNAPPPSVFAQNLTISTLNTAINNSTTTVIINTPYNGHSVLPPPLNYTITIDQEEMLVTGSVGSPGIFTLTVTRGINGTVKAAHIINAPIVYTPLVGFDSVLRSTPIATYSGRLWYGIGNILFFSGNEEISAGVPEECFPSGLLGNFYRFAKPIVNVISTSEALYVLCLGEIHWIKGSTKDSFELQKLFDDVGGARDYPYTCTTADKSIIFMTDDYRICIARGFKRDFLSDALGNDLLNQVTTAELVDIQFLRYAHEEKDLLIINCFNFTDATHARQFIYDFNQTDQGLWNVPWAIKSSFMLSARGVVDSSGIIRNNWFVAAYDLVGPFQPVNAILTTIDLTYANMSDQGTTYPCNYTLSLVRNPTGNHVNMLREPGMVSVLQAIKVDRTTFTSDNDPVLTYYLDNSTGSSGVTAPAPVIPPRRVQSTGYATLWYEVNKSCERISINLSKVASTERFETQMIAYVWNPDSGA